MALIGSGSRRRRPRVSAAAAAFLSGLFAATMPTAGRTEVNVAGSPAAVRIRTSDDSIAKVLAAMAQTFDVRYSTSIAFDDIVSGTYSGSLSEAIASLLSGYNYVIHYRHGIVDIAVIGRRGKRPVSDARAPQAARTFAAQWRR